MASRLSSLLVRDGLVSVKRMERAFQRQVIYGGQLDTVLLEMDLLPEERLLQYLSLATGLPPATREDLAAIDGRAHERCPEEIAGRYRVAPLSIDGDALRVLVSDPVDLGALESLANDIDIAVQPLIAPEYRFHVVFNEVFGHDADGRFCKLAETAGRAPAAPAVGKPKTVIVETSHPHARDGSSAPPSPTSGPNLRELIAEAPPGAAQPAAPRRTSTLEMSSDALARHLAETDRARQAAEAARGRAPGARDEDADSDDDDDDDEPPQPQAETPASQRDDAAAAGRRRPGSEADAGAAAVAGDLLRDRDGGDDDGDGDARFTATRAKELLAAAANRDMVFETLLRAVRGCADYAALLTVQGGAAIGRIALTGDGFTRDAVAQVLIPLDVPSPFRQVSQSASPYIGPVATGDRDIDGMIERMGGVIPPAALLLPVTLRHRVVAIAVGHRGDKPIGIAEMSELLPVAGAAADALGQLIMKAKSGARAAVEAATQAVPGGVESLPTQKLQRLHGTDAPAGAEAGGAAGTEQPTADGAAADNAPTDKMPPVAPPLSRILDGVESNDDRVAETSIRRALAEPEATLELVAGRFPGKLRVDRYALRGRQLRASQLGPILDLVVRLGRRSGDMLARKMEDADHDVRYYATLCAVELRPREAIAALVDRLFDSDLGVREAALLALAGYPQAALNAALEVARNALAGDDVDRIEAAAEALTQLADADAVPELIAAQERGVAAEPARRALVDLTKQDFGASARKWRSWWSKNRERHRLEWMIDSLVHKDGDVRHSAAEELRRITGEYFGYHHDLGKRERLQAQKRWEAWWQKTGRRRFPKDDPEAARATAILPPQRRDD